MIEPGDMRARVRFEKMAEGAATYGRTRGAWSTQFSRSAMIRNLRGGEEVTNKRLAGVQPVLIVVPYDPETVLIRTNWRAVELADDGTDLRTYGLKTAADTDGDRAYISMIAEQGGADGAR